MASFKSSQSVSLLLVALLVCQAFMVPSLARTQVVIGAKKLSEQRRPDMVTAQGHGGHGYGDHSGHRHGEDSGHGGAEYGGHGYRGHGHKDGGHAGAGHKGGHG